jgi:hypothetical protein
LVNVRVRINLETNPGLTQSLSPLLINLKAPNGNIINIKQLGDGVDDIYLRNSIFTGTQSRDFNLGAPLYEGPLNFSTNLIDYLEFIPGTMLGSFITNPLDLDGYYVTIDKVEDLFLNTTKGYWEVYIKTFDGLDVKVNDIKLEFCYSDKIGSQIDSPIINGFDTGLRIVSKFVNTDWKTGIWTNGIFESGLFETGIWYDGIFEQLKADTLYCQMQAPARAAAPKRMRRRCLASPLQSVKPVSQDAEQ